MREPGGDEPRDVSDEEIETMLRTYEGPPHARARPRRHRRQFLLTGAAAAAAAGTAASLVLLLDDGKNREAILTPPASCPTLAFRGVRYTLRDLEGAGDLRQHGGPARARCAGGERRELEVARFDGIDTRLALVPRHGQDGLYVAAGLCLVGSDRTRLLRCLRDEAARR